MSGIKERNGEPIKDYKETKNEITDHFNKKKQVDLYNELIPNSYIEMDN